MISILEKQIETYLFAAGGWVPAKRVCNAFGVNQRALRAVGNKPGLCSEFAISGNSGLKHIEHASTLEWLRFKHRLRRHGIGELVRVQKLQKRRGSVMSRIKQHFFEKDTGQGLLFPTDQPAT